MRPRQQLSVIVAGELVEELRDAAVERMGDGATLASMTEEALTAGLAEIRSRYFKGQPPPRRRHEPRPGRRAR
jgi:hypothetical protein